MNESSLPLQGIRVLELGQVYNGPYAGFLMAMAGADVVKVEPPQGEHLRDRGAEYPFVVLNANKRSITVNLKRPGGREILFRLVQCADVLTENFVPGTLERLGVSPDTLMSLNPRLVYGSSSGFGRTGPYRNRPAMDLSVQAMAGVLSVTGRPDEPPLKAGPAIADFLGGIHLYAAIVTALYEREVIGRGRLVEVSMQEAVLPSLMSNFSAYVEHGRQTPPRTGNRHGSLAVAPYNVYRSADGHVVILCGANRHWVSLTEVMGCPELGADPRFSSVDSRAAHIDEIDSLVGDWCATRGTREITQALLERAVPCSPVMTLADLDRDPHLRARGMLVDINHPTLGRIPVMRSPLGFGEPSEPLRPSPDLGEHNEQVLREWLQLEAEEIRSLLSVGAR
jgi:CoA:oxalate CoA-transferase